MERGTTQSGGSELQTRGAETEGPKGRMSQAHRKMRGLSWKSQSPLGTRVNRPFGQGWTSPRQDLHARGTQPPPLDPRGN